MMVVAGSGMVVMEVPVHVPKRPMVSSMLRAAIKTFLMGALMSSGGLTVEGPVSGVVPFVAIVVAMGKGWRYQRHHSERGGSNAYQLHLRSPRLRARRGKTGQSRQLS
jgi:hypothetical protein